MAVARQVKRRLAALAAYLFLLAQVAPVRLLGRTTDNSAARTLVFSVAGRPRLALNPAYPYVRVIRDAAADGDVEPVAYRVRPPAARAAAAITRCLAGSTCSSGPPPSGSTGTGGGSQCVNLNTPPPPQPVTTNTAGHTTTCTSLCRSHVSHTITYPPPPSGGGGTVTSTRGTSCGYDRAYCSSSCLRSDFSRGTCHPIQ